MGQTYSNQTGSSQLSGKIIEQKNVSTKKRFLRGVFFSLSLLFVVVVVVE